MSKLTAYQCDLCGIYYKEYQLLSVKNVMTGETGNHVCADCVETFEKVLSMSHVAVRLRRDPCKGMPGCIHVGGMDFITTLTP